MVWSRLLSFAIFFFSILSSLAQVGENRYLVYFADKAGTPYSVNQPEEFLSDRAILRRINQNIPVTVEDLPVNPDYIDEVKNLGDIEVIYSLKWFNAILIETEDSTVIDQISNLDDVIGTQISPVISNDYSIDMDSEVIPDSPKNNYAYGPSFNQTDMLNGIPLHEAGYAGEGILVGVFDGGFTSALQDSSLKRVFAEDRIVATRNFISSTDSVYERSTHGTYVLSCMAGYLEDSLIGTAPEASYLLCITEDVSVERQIELANWAAAAEYADSAGVDIINTSLGYTLFDVDEENFTYELLDGNTTLITRAANIAASKGILAVTSAGNSGNSPWYYISAPADADQVLAIGAVKPDETIASFSSRGPRVDGAVKPNVVAQGQAAIVGDLNDGIRAVNGTSFASPILAGMAASLWQAVPQATAQEVFSAIEQSASLFQNPNDSLGYGIPDFVMALEHLQDLTSTRDISIGNQGVKIFPNPITEGMMLNFMVPKDLGDRLTFELFDIAGKQILHRELNVIEGRARLQTLPQLSEGLYIINVRGTSGAMATSKLIIR
jgi:subtilisin family serine protease